MPEHEHAAQVDLRKSEEASAAARSGGRGASYERYSAQRHRELADEHAAAAGARRKEVAAVCAEATIRENDVPKRLRNPRGYYPERLRGARIALQVGEATARAAAARSFEWEAARTAAGLEPVDLASPFAVRSARAIVRAEDPGIVIEVRGDQGEAAEEILRRATVLAQAARQDAR